MSKLYVVLAYLTTSLFGAWGRATDENPITSFQIGENIGSLVPFFLILCLFSFIENKMKARQSK